MFQTFPGATCFLLRDPSLASRPSTMVTFLGCNMVPVTMSIEFSHRVPGAPNPPTNEPTKPHKKKEGTQDKKSDIWSRPRLSELSSRPGGGSVFPKSPNPMKKRESNKRNSRINNGERGENRLGDPICLRVGGLPAPTSTNVRPCGFVKSCP